MKKLNFLMVMLYGIIMWSCGEQKVENEKFSVMKATDANGFEYEYITNDPTQTRIYTLKNGLKVYLSQNNAEPRIQTLVSVKAGSTFDPKETTGLAHYLEHMMFKGTSKIGTKNWEAEKELLKQISDLYEQHKATNNLDEKKKIYAKIDSVSQEAAKYAIPNEFDKLVTSIGAKNTNAYTSNEETVYINDIPSNELEKWIKLERERFGEIVLRIFHTELETVYEEYNRSQDNDYSKTYHTLYKNLFPTHPYGQQTTIGEAEHLKNPSLVNIQNYFNTYYRPNNMAIILAGEFNPDEAIKIITTHWSDLQPNPNIKKPEFAAETPISKPVEVEVFGPDAEYLQMAFRFNGIGSEDEKYATVIKNILSNRTAGLIDLNLVQKQQVLEAGASTRFLKDYGVLSIYATARENQSLDDVKSLILNEIEKVKAGDFEDWLVEAIINDLRVSEIRRLEENYRAYFINESFIRDVSWQSRLQFLDNLKGISKQQIIDFAKANLNNNYVCVYKKTGTDPNQVKVEKPQITSIPINRTDQSTFFTEFTNQKSAEIKPVFVDYKKEISQKEIAPGLTFYHIQNKKNELFTLEYIVDMGQNTNPKIPMAFEYLNFIGTQNRTAEEIKKEFFKLGVSFSVYAGQDRCYITLSGLESSMEKATALLEELLADAKGNQDSYNEFAKGVLKKRSDSKLNKNVIKFYGINNFAMYGKENPFTNDLSNEEVTNLNPDELIAIIKEISGYKHLVFYYGQKTQTDAESAIFALHKPNGTLKNLPEMKQFVAQATTQNKVYIVNYDMVQADVMLFAKSDDFNKNLLAMGRLFNEFYGSGLSSIVFQEIRESKGLAYTAYAQFKSPQKLYQSHFLNAYVGSQPDKLHEAISEMVKLLNNMPQADKQFELAKESILRKIETERLIKTRIFWSYLSNRDKRIDYDNRQEIYETIKNATLKDMELFFNKYIANNNFTMVVMGNEKDLPMDVLKQFGPVEKLTLNDLFPY